MDDNFYTLVEVPLSSVVQPLLEAVTATFLVLWCWRRLQHGPWAGVGGICAAVWAVTSWTTFAACAWTYLHDDMSTLLTWTDEHSGALTWLRAVGVAGAVLAVTAGREAPSASRP